MEQMSLDSVAAFGIFGDFFNRLGGFKTNLLQTFNWLTYVDFVLGGTKTLPAWWCHIQTCHNLPVDCAPSWQHRVCADHVTVEEACPTCWVWDAWWSLKEPSIRSEQNREVIGSDIITAPQLPFQATDPLGPSILIGKWQMCHRATASLGELNESHFQREWGLTQSSSFSI